MDWNSEEGRALLWKAYPDGYLARRGVLTVGGWQCVEGEEGEDEEDGDTSSWWRPIPDNDGLTELGLLRDLPDARVNAGDLLPLPDPTDTATWACLLQDLAEASNRFEHRKPWVGFAFDIWPDTPAPAGYRCWIFSVHDTGGRSFASFTLPESITDEDGGAEALIRARASLQ